MQIKKYKKNKLKFFIQQLHRHHCRRQNYHQEIVELIMLPDDFLLASRILDEKQFLLQMGTTISNPLIHQIYVSNVHELDDCPTEREKYVLLTNESDSWLQH